MKLQILASAATVALALSTATAIAVALTHPVGNVAGTTPSSPWSQPDLLREPGYGVGTGAAHIGDGFSPSYQQAQQELRHGPGYSIGAGTAQVRSNG